LKGLDRNRLGRYSAGSSVRCDRAASIGHQRNRHSIRTADTPAIGDTVNGYAVTSWLGVAGPAGLPVPFVSGSTPS
jgi:hypothetical protein